MKVASPISVTGGSTSFSGVTDVQGSIFSACGGAFSGFGLTDADSSKFTVSGGGTLVLPAPLFAISVKSGNATANNALAAGSIHSVTDASFPVPARFR